MNNLILVRHGQSVWNKEKRFTGWVDVDLTSEGKSEAEYAGQLIKSLNIDLNYYFTSKLKRAMHSLDIILKILNKESAEVIKNEALNERHYGDLTSLNKEETKKKYGEEQVKIWRRSFEVPPPSITMDHPFKDKINSNIKSESLKDTFNRVIPYYQKEIEPLIFEKKNILVVFHGNSCRALLMKIFNISKENIIRFEIPTGNPLLIEFNDSFKIEKYRYLDDKRAKKIFFNT